MRQLARALATALLLLVTSGVVDAATLAAGSDVPAIALTDQHDRKASLGPDVRIVVLTRDMAAGDTVKEGFAGMDQAALEMRGAVYVADISGMPSMIATMFAVPKMRDRSYRILLDRDGTATRDFPYVEGRPTVLFVDQGKIARVAQPANGDELRHLLQPQAAQ